MRYHLIFNKKCKYIGFTKKKSIVDEFLKQREGMQYGVEVMSKESIKKIKEVILDENHELIKHRGVWVFPNEVRYLEFDFYVLLEELFGGINCCYDVMKFLKFDESEKEIMDGFFAIIESFISQIENFYRSTKNIEHYGDILKIKKMVKRSLRSIPEEGV